MKLQLTMSLLFICIGAPLLAADMSIEEYRAHMNAWLVAPLTKTSADKKKEHLQALLEKSHPSLVEESITRLLAHIEANKKTLDLVLLKMVFLVLMYNDNKHKLIAGKTMDTITLNRLKRLAEKIKNHNQGKTVVTWLYDFQEASPAIVDKMLELLPQKPAIPFYNV